MFRGEEKMGMNIEAKTFSNEIGFKFCNKLNNDTDFMIISNQDSYDFDFEINGIKIEFEVRTVWMDLKFPFKTIHIPFRKEKLLKSDADSIYVIINFNFSCILFIDSYAIIKSNVIGINTTRAQNEQFFDVDIKNCQYGFKKLIDKIKHLRMGATNNNS